MTTTLPNSFDIVRSRVQQSSRCQAAAGFYELSFQAMNTHCRVNFASGDPALARSFQQEVLRWVAWFEAQYSRFIPDSLIGRINAAAGLHWVEVDPETDALLNLCHDMVFLSRGVFDPTSLPLMRLWNWKAKPPAVPTPSAVAASRELAGWEKLQRREGGVFLPRDGMCLDLGGIGKEYAVDRVLMMGLDRGIANLLVDFGQDVRVHGQPPGRVAWHIGLEDPTHPGECWTGVAVNNHAVATSGDYVRHFTVEGRRYGHIIDARDGYPVNNGCLSVSIIAPNCTVAGILSTSAFILGPKEGLDLIRFCPGVEGAITTDKSRVQTRNFSAYATQ
ncbi:MAG TPA: FAD:protein FMN transferase [Candidatus Saccharimonadales bacterium]|nr:FAD:protein FMN transferase [Candidatus Saccharimonadales bacterium]